MMGLLEKWRTRALPMVENADKRMGVPRTLGFDKYRIFFDKLMILHGFEIVVSPPSSRRILRRGLTRSIDEVCFPLKTFLGHVDALYDEGVRTVLIPRWISAAKGRNNCPKFAVLPDLVAQIFPELRLVSPYIDLHHAKTDVLQTHLFDACRQSLKELGCWGKDSSAHLLAAYEAQQQQRQPSIGLKMPGALNIAVLGHSYGEQDPFLNLNLLKLLEDQGATVVTTPEPLPNQLSPFEDGIYYEPSLATARGIAYSITHGVHGVILVTFFACGPDSYAADTFLYRLKAAHVELPVMRLIFDEHTSVEGLMTRVSTFVDVARHFRDKPGKTGC